MRLSPSQAQRYARHVLLDEVGAAGQLRLLSTSVRVAGTGVAAEEAARYLVAAGVGNVLADDALLQEHQASWSGLNGEVELASEGVAEHTVELGESGSRLEGARAALAVLVTVGVEVGR